MAADVHSAELAKQIEKALSSFQRRSGLDDLVRIHRNAIGQAAYSALTKALASSPSIWYYEYGGAVEIRMRLRWQMYRYLTQRLIQDGHATNAMRDAGFSGDLGL
ncbi:MULTISPECIES: hypothetical protein [Pseudomonas]|uniref:Uncharacterized protein n=1 Tax=Pseudomonas syringae pv. papulans TaxID=83963 RepID=A0AA43IWH2_PSESX|nr:MULTISPECIES: hypothetical protein [Pseudomonas]KWS42654.1 hypothetical protein AL059_18250 [Pseudomonas syringae pv. papulans]MDH4601315.1 hypothetical protein [Pseudomonas syringae pv. papulans]MDH4622970.1 hypothetical protein [Pseudomonas syringae pv. papulans]OEC53286.1 hypothetical protein A7K61_21035 [Pseudomonas sp. AP42]RMN82132.1 hypothetical protein ALQ56_02713 [Pseudomonas syringae pv. papulans]